MNPFGKGRRDLITAAWFGAASFGASRAESAVTVVGTPRATRPNPAPGEPGVFEVTRFGAVGDGKTASTRALQRAIDTCGESGGGTVLVAPGRYLTGALFLRSHVHLHLPQGATLVGSQNPDDFPPIRGREEGVEKTIHASMLTGLDLEGVAITGDGVIDGAGAAWWQADQTTWQMRIDLKVPRDAPNPPAAPLKYPRPRTINLIRCHDVFIEGVNLRDGPGVNIQLVYCQDVVIQRITSSQRQQVRSSEAVIIDSSQRVTISHCRLNAGADAIGLKSGYNEEGRRIGLAVEDVLITNCLLFKISSGVVIGSETAGGVRNVMIKDCVIHDCLSGIRIRAPRGRGGLVEKIQVSNLVVDAVTDMVIKVSNYFDSIVGEGRFNKVLPSRKNVELARSRKAPVDEGTPTFRDFSFSRLTIGQAKGVALFEGLPERFLDGVTLSGVTARRVTSGVFCSMVSNVSIDDVLLEGLEDPAIDAREVQRLEVHRLRCPTPPPDAPVVWLENVARAFVHGCDVGPRKEGPWLEHEQCRELMVVANNAAPLPAQPEAPPLAKKPG